MPYSLVATFQIFIRPSALLETTYKVELIISFLQGQIDHPAGEVESCPLTCNPDEMKSTRRTAVLWPWNVLRQAPLFKAHNLMLRSPEAVAIVCSTGENAAAQTPFLCPRSVSSRTSDGSFQTWDAVG